MVHIEGTYHTVKTQAIVDEWISVGFAKEEVEKLAGSHWTIKVWSDGNLWGGHMTCKEHPELNSLEVFNLGVEKSVDHPIFGGKAKVVCHKNGDTFKTVAQTEKFGEVVLTEKYTDEGVTMAHSVKGKTIIEQWERCVKISGAYVYEKGENLAAYFKAVGFPVDDIEASMKNYKMHVCYKDSTLNTKEWFDGHLIDNSMTLDVEGPIRYPDDAEGATPKRRGIMTKAGVAKFVGVSKTPGGPDEEWTYTFTDCGVLLSGFEKKTNQAAKIYLKRFTDFTGTFKITTVVGFKEFASTLGMPDAVAQEMLNDTSARMIITDTGNGCQRHQMITSKYSMDLAIKLNEEFTFFHPLLNENVTAVATVKGSTMSTVAKTSKGNIVSTIHSNDTFSVACIGIAGTKIGYKVIFERCSK
jgi:hypothetical protein